MKTTLIALLILLAFLACSGQADFDKATNIQKARNVVADYAIHCNELEHENAQLKAVLQNLANDIVKVKDMDELNAVCEKYGIKKAD